MRRYSLWVMEYGSRREVELCQCDENPRAIAYALRAKTLPVRVSADTDKKSKIRKYSSVRIVDNWE
jgi:hypothetical protein